MKLAMVFPGQGSQSIGMMAGFDAHPLVRETFAEASDVLQQDMWMLVTEGPDTELNQTVNTQPLMLTAGFAVWRAWVAAGGPMPSVVAGHSLGEYTALVAAGSLAFAEAVALVRFRAQVMQEAVPSGVGAMAAILGLDDAAVCAACVEAAQDQIVEAVNFNSLAQVVIAGHRQAVERAIDAAKARGAKRGMLLPVSAPFHSSLMKTAAQRLAARLATTPFATPKIAVLHNVDVAEHALADDIRDALARQAAGPVRWVETIQTIASRGATHVIECGPGRVLNGLTRKIAPSVTALPIGDGVDLEAALKAVTP